MASSHPQTSIGQQFIIIGDRLKSVEQSLPAAKREQFERLLMTEVFNEFRDETYQHQQMLVETVQTIHQNESTAMKTVVSIGITGTGKSALNNLLCQPEAPFSVSNSVHSHTAIHQVHFSPMNGLKVVDTVGFLDTELTMDEVLSRIVAAINQLSDGIDVILFVAKFGRISSIEIDALRLVIEAILGESACSHLILALTHVPTQLARSRDDQRQWLDSQSKLGDQKFNLLYRTCSGRVAFVANPPMDDDAAVEAINCQLREASRQNLMSAIHSVDGPCFTPELAREAQAKFGEKKKCLEQEAARARSEAERELGVQAICDYQQQMDNELANALNQALRQRDEAVSQLRQQILATSLAQRNNQSRHDHLARVGHAISIGVEKVVMKQAESCSIL